MSFCHLRKLAWQKLKRYWKDPLIPFDGIAPQVDASVFIAPTAYLTGKVSVAQNVSIFFGVVARGEILAVSIGA